MTKEELLKQFVKDLVDIYPLGNKNAKRIFDFYCDWIGKNADKFINPKRRM